MVDISSLNCMMDLHLHLDGALSPESCRRLAALCGIAVPDSDEELRNLLTVSPDCRDLNEFLEKFAFPCSLLQTEETIALAVRTLKEELKEQGLMYAEIRFAPQKSTEKGLSQRKVLEAALRGQAQSELPTQLILCCMRDKDNREENLETVRLAAEYLGRGVAAVDLAGAEALYPTKDFEDEFCLARELKVPITIHAGEADGPESVETALSFGASRIGHGVRSAESEALIRRLAEKKIPLELCPTSNLNTQVFPSLDRYPLRRFPEAGVPVTINTDDPVICGTTIRGEWQKLIDEFQLTDAELQTILLQSAEASFASEQEKNRMKERIFSSFRENSIL